MQTLCQPIRTHASQFIESHYMQYAKTLTNQVTQKGQSDNNDV